MLLSLLSADRPEAIRCVPSPLTDWSSQSDVQYAITTVGKTVCYYRNNHNTTYSRYMT